MEITTIQQSHARVRADSFEGRDCREYSLPLWEHWRVYVCLCMCVYIYTQFVHYFKYRNVERIAKIANSRLNFTHDETRR